MYLFVVILFAFGGRPLLRALRGRDGIPPPVISDALWACRSMSCALEQPAEG